eukprot:TRINITY_DN7589_c2_g1_i1.p1 TRINITY_DN7589_c2_g1~~TRINITY_DN7589_c2_g1_i1.p1  ORF type:complete len:110 (+),score=26.93 TRINITY_DN7589_c2_g1_i1:1-330(+)
MPLVEVFAREGQMPTFKASELTKFLEQLFGVEPGVCQVMMTSVKDIAPEPVYFSIRAKGTPPRIEKIKDLLAEMGKWLSNHGVPQGKVRIELFEPSQQNVHSWNASSRL